MIKPIVKNVLFLGQKSERATKADINVIKDLQDTLAANSETCVGMAANMIGYKKRIIIVNVGFVNMIMGETCVGMAANMIGYKKRIIIVNVGFVNMIMVNPKIVRKAFPFETEEGCLSLDGTRPTTRYKQIEVEFEDINFKKQRKKFTDWTAQIIQHEIDHCDGIII